MEWFRWYHGACSDAKWPLIARKAHTTVGVVVSVWVALLEYASQDDERGRPSMPSTATATERARPF